jgi:hypothetical protein
MSRAPRGRKKQNRVSSASISSWSAFRRAIHSRGPVLEGLDQYRSQLLESAIPAIVEELWRSPLYRSTIAVDPFPRSYDRIKTRAALQPATPSLDLHWHASVLSKYADQINSFLIYKELYADAFLSSDFDGGQAVLDTIEEELGLSLWLTSARLSLLQARGGVSEQKTFLSDVLQGPRINPITAYIAFYTSYRLEDHVSITEIRREFEPSEGGLTQNDFTEYLRYHVIPLDLETIRSPHVCITLEESSPIIDRYETFVEMAQLMFARSVELAALSTSLPLLGTVDDRRIYNLLFCLGVDNSSVSRLSEFDVACELYTRGSYVDAARTLSNHIRANPGSMLVYELAARTQGHAEITAKEGSIGKAIISEFAAYLNVSKDLSTTRSELQKLGLLCGKLPAGRCIAALLDRSIDLTVEPEFSTNQILWALNSPLCQPQHFRLFATIAPEQYAALTRAVADESSVAIALHILCADPPKDSAELIAKLDLPSDRALLYAAYALFNAKDFLAAKEQFELYKVAVSDTPRARAINFQYALLRKLGSVADALAAFVDSYLANPRSQALFPLEEIASWAVSVAASDKCAVDRAILLHAHSAHRSPAFDADLSDALEDVLDYFSVDAPSDLFDLDIPTNKLIYFLRHVASLARLEDTTRFDTVDDIELERIKVLQWLVQADPGNRNAYTSEISSITKDQEVAKLSARFERSKIYVHEEGVRRLLENAIGDNFSRYKQLLSEPNLEIQADSLEKKIRKILKDSDSEFRYLFIPSTESDSMFVSMVQRAIEIFGLDPTHGLKTYLSTRILHGVLEGELRSSSASEGLLFSSENYGPDGAFRARWSDLFSRYSASDQVDIARAASRFNERVTEAIARLKDKKIRLWSADLTDGLIRIVVTDRALIRLKRSVAPNTTFGEFFTRLFAMFWDSVETCLKTIKEEISGPFRKQMLSAFDGLSSALEPLSKDGRLSEMLDAVARAKSAFLVDLERVSAWFGRSGVLSNEPFTLDIAVQVATRITDNCYPTYPLETELQSERYVLSGEILNPLVDLLTNCFQNAAEHSGVQGRAPVVAVAVSQLSDLDLAVVVTAELDTGVNLDLCRAEILELLNEDDSLNRQAVAGEGRTGIRKMKRILKHDLRALKPLLMSVDDDHIVNASFAIPMQYRDANRTH